MEASMATYDVRNEVIRNEWPPAVRLREKVQERHHRNEADVGEHNAHPYRRAART